MASLAISWYICTLVDAAEVVYCLADVVRKVLGHGRYRLKALMQWAIHILPEKELEQRHLLRSAQRSLQAGAGVRLE